MIKGNIFFMSAKLPGTAPFKFLKIRAEAVLTSIYHTEKKGLISFVKSK